MEAAYPHVAMLLVQLSYSGSNILMKVACERGLNQFIFVAYRHMIASLLLCPFAYVLERKMWPELSLKVAAKIFAVSSLGTTIHLNVYYTGLEYISPTVATALSNLIPCLTFLIAVLLRMETVTLKTLRGRVKVMGTLISIGGSFVFTLWKGKCLVNGDVHRPLIDIYGSNGNESELRHVKESWLKGSALILLSSFTWSLWLIFQGVVYKDYPAQLSLNALICLFATFQSSILALFFARDPSLWKLEWNVQLWTIIYCGVVIAALVNNLLMWGISRKGPVFAAMFNPLQVVIVGMFSAVAFAERFHLGSLIGTFLIIFGLYCVLWGKSKENEIANELGNEKGSPNTKKIEVSIVNNYQEDSEKCSAGSQDQNGALGTQFTVRS
ncbi:WAT1-related protein At1g43650-like isoform X2 [Punica granatum]|uniref:WAT1-related protein n=1 Tax=Punica granatum TaxID=22663 RepID=A0A6P8C4B1_PUNGR|nr:WAT1-related protein At1g43650-like isoform X2 [Punica granatum]